MPAAIYKGYRFPPAIISRCVWLYYRFSVSLRDASELMLARGIEVSHEAILRRLLRGLRMMPCAIVTDRLASYAAAKAVVMPTVSHLRGRRQNNRVENSHQPVRQRERQLQRFKSLRHAARFCSVFSTVCNQFRPGRHALSAPNYRTMMRQRWREWDVVSETTAFAVAA
jgi:putative transposase